MADSSEVKALRAKLREIAEHLRSAEARLEVALELRIGVDAASNIGAARGNVIVARICAEVHGRDDDA